MKIYTNGYVTFGLNFERRFPDTLSKNLFSYTKRQTANKQGFAMLTPLWTDNDARSGAVYYHIYDLTKPGSTAADQARVKHAVDQARRDVIAHGGVSITDVTWVMVITWSQMLPRMYYWSEYDSPNTFQLIIAYDPSRYQTFAMFVYVDLGWNNDFLVRRNMIGYLSFKDDETLQLAPSMKSTAFRLHTQIGNTGERGRYMFLVASGRHEINYDQKCYNWFANEMRRWRLVRFYWSWTLVCPCDFRLAKLDGRWTFDWRQYYETGFERRCIYERMPWTQSTQEVSETSKQGIVIYNFSHVGPQLLQLNVGETVSILCQSEDWFYGHCINNRRQKGIFPKSYVHPKNNTWQYRQTGSHHKAALQEAQLVEEITSVLNEWNDLWKRLYITNRSSASDFEFIRILMTSLIDSRKLIMSSKHTVDEMKELKQRATTQIDLGNARLGLDLVVRDEEGNVLDPVMTSTVSLFRRHQVAAKRKQENRTSDTSDHRKSTSFNLFVNVKNFVCRIGDDADILMMLYDAKEGQPISENYIMKWGKPRHATQSRTTQLPVCSLHGAAVTQDLGLQDSNRERVFLVCLIIRLGRMDLRLPDTKKQSHGLRRPFGVAATEVTDILKGNVQADEEKQYFVPFQLCGEKDFLDNVVKKVVTAKDINHKGQGVWVTMRKLHGDLKQVQKEYPHLMTNSTAIARKMGFPDVIMPDDVRYDLYVTIMQAELKRTGRSTDRNIEVTLCVCNQNGDVLQNVISEGAGGDMVSEYKTVVYYHDDKPKWCETVKVAIPIDDFYGSHLKLMFKHRASAEAKDRCERPFAMSYIKLMQDNGTTLKDTRHDLLVYKIDSKKMDQSSTYLKLPATECDLESQSQPGLSPSKCQIHAGGLTLNINDSFQISTLVCSTKLTHNGAYIIAYAMGF
ncbi:Dedicator of cytokinesis protein 1 [Lamellibrachia satsuma]|nr:Dedicator of cytokinesis protein 1 [Lamellibrachia satsuma]